MKLNNQVINWVFLLFLGVRWSAFNGKYAHAWTHKVILQQSPCGNHLISGLKQSPKDLMDVVVSKKTDVLTLPAVCRGKSCAFHWKSRFTVYLSNVLHVWIHMLAIELRLCRERTDHLRSWGFGDKRSSQRADRGSGNWGNPAADCAALLYLHLRWTEEGVACSSLMDQGSAACWVEECIHCAPDSAQWDSQSALPGPGNDHDYAKCGLSVLCWWWIWYVTERRRGVTTAGCCQALASFSYLNLWKKKKKILRTHKPLTTTRGHAKCCKNVCSFLFAYFNPSRKPQVVLGPFFPALTSPVSLKKPGQFAVSSIQRKTKHIPPLLILCVVWFTLNSFSVVMVILRAHRVKMMHKSLLPPRNTLINITDVRECK